MPADLREDMSPAPTYTKTYGEKKWTYPVRGDAYGCPTEKEFKDAKTLAKQGKVEQLRKMVGIDDEAYSSDDVISDENLYPEFEYLIDIAQKNRDLKEKKMYAKMQRMDEAEETEGQYISRGSTGELPDYTRRKRKTEEEKNRLQTFLANVFKPKEKR